MLHSVSMSKPSKFVLIKFEGIPERTLPKIVTLLEDTLLYEHIGMMDGNLVGALRKSRTKAALSKLQDIFHEHNGGQYCELEYVDYDDIEHLV